MDDKYLNALPVPIRDEMEGMNDEEAFNAEAGPSNGGKSPHTLPQISKNQQKKAARLARVADQRPLKRQAEKARRKENAQKLAEGYANGSLSVEERAVWEERKAKQAARRRARHQDKAVRHHDTANGAVAGGSERRKAVWGGSVIMDLGFDELMTDQEITSMAAQLSNSYATNRIAHLPFFAVIHTSASAAHSPRLVHKLGQLAHERWSNSIWYPEPLEHFVADFQATMTNGTTDGQPEEHGDPPSNIVGKLQAKGMELVYLSADAEGELETLSENEVYIIGGLVDRNRHKNKADRLGVRSARLPIGKYIENLPTRKVLTVNQVLQILTEYLAKRDWKEAFETVIPPRKFVEKKKRKRERVNRQGEAVEKGVDGDEDSSEDGDLGVDQGVTDALDEEELAMNA